MKKIAAALVFASLCLAFAPVANAAGYIPIPGELCGTGSFPCPAGDTGIEQAKNITAKIVDNVRFIIGAIAVITIFLSAMQLITAQGNEEEFTKQTTTLTFAILGLFVVGLAGDMAAIFDVDKGGFLKDPNVALQRSRLFNRTVEIVITFIKYIIGSVAVLYIIRSTLYLLIYGGKEEELGKYKKNIFSALLGLVIILMSSPIINNVFFKIQKEAFPGGQPVQPGIDAKRLALEIAGVTNLVAMLAGPFALLSLVAGSLMYILAAGDEEKTGKAKKIMIWSLVGLLVIYGAFAIVSLFVSRQFTTVAPTEPIIGTMLF